VAKPPGDHPLGEKSFVVVVTANPKPGDGITIKNANGSIAKRDPHGPDIFLTVNALEMKRRMKGILCP
jgi:hypothetical protein